MRVLLFPPIPDDYKQYDSEETRANGGYNLGFYKNPQIDRAIQAARSAASQAKPGPRLTGTGDSPQMIFRPSSLFEPAGRRYPNNLAEYELTPFAAAALPTVVQFWHLQPSSGARR